MTSTHVHDRRRRVAITTLAVVATCAIASVVARRQDHVAEGLRVQYFSHADRAAAPELTAIDRQPDTEAVSGDWSGQVPQAFNAVWSGWLLAPQDGFYTFAIDAEGPALLEIEGRVLVDTLRGQADPIHLTRGAHSLFMHYEHDGGVPSVSVRWSRRGTATEPLPAWLLRTRQLSYTRFLVDRVLDYAEGAALMAVTLSLIWTVWVCWGSTIGIAAASEIGADAWPVLGAIVVLSAILNIAGVSWGLPSGDWVGDELGPYFVLDAIAHRFAHGWFTIYPPMQYYVLAVAYLPMLILDWLGFVDLHATLAHGLMALSGRLTSVVMAGGVIMTTFFTGRRAFGSRAGLFAAVAFALAAPFVYYAKTANVEMAYLFWLSVCLMFYLRVLAGAPTSDYVWWSITGTLAVCTKDQAYAFCAGMPIAVVFVHWRGQRRAGATNAIWRSISDRRLLVACVCALVTFALAQNFVFNMSGFIGHIRYVTAYRVSSYRMFEPTVTGRMALVRLTAHLVRLTWGWPLFLVGLLGIAWSLALREHRRVAVCLVIPVVSYYLGFTNLVLYNYDRFVLPMALVLVLFAGLFLDRGTAACTSARSWRLAGVAVVLAYTLLYSATVDVLMLRDSRYAIERWVDGNVQRNELIATIGIPRYLPRLESRATLDIDRVETLNGARPRFVIVNADYTRSEDAHSGHGAAFETLRSAHDYRLVVKARSESPWSWLPGGHPDLVGPRLDLSPTSFLRNINPTIEVFERR